MDLFKTKLTKSNRQLLIVALSLVAAAVTLYVVYAATTRRNISLMSPEGQPVAANPSCLLNLTLNRPTPTATPVVDLICNSVCTSSSQCPTGLTCASGKCRNPSCTSKTNCLCATPTPTPKVTPTPTPKPPVCNSVCSSNANCPTGLICKKATGATTGYCRNPSCTSKTNCICPTLKPTATPSNVCKITTIPADHTAVCWTNPQTAVLKVKIESLPSANAPYYLQTDWYLAAPTEGEHHYYTLPNPISAGQTYNISGQWPGIPEGSNETIDIVIGYNVVDKNGNIVGGMCANGFNYYWTPYVNCP